MTSYKLNEEKMFCDIEDNVAVVINSETGIYYSMNTFSTNVFENIIKGISIKTILDGVKKIAEAPADLEKKLNAFVKSLLKNELITEDSESKEKVKLNAKLAKSDDFVFKVIEYTDAQELLLADPIHDVKDETGWKPILSAKEDDTEKIKKKKEKEKNIVERKTAPKAKVKKNG